MNASPAQTTVESSESTRWTELSDRLTVELAVAAASRRIASAYARN